MYEKNMCSSTHGTKKWWSKINFMPSYLCFISMATYLPHVDKRGHFIYPLPTSSFPRRHWMTPWYKFLWSHNHFIFWQCTLYFSLLFSNLELKIVTQKSGIWNESGVRPCSFYRQSLRFWCHNLLSSSQQSHCGYKCEVTRHYIEQSDGILYDVAVEYFWYQQW